MALYTPFSSQLTDITKVNFQLLFSERNAMASSAWQGNVIWDVMETSVRLGLQVDPCLPRSRGEHSREVWVEVCCRGLQVQRSLTVKLYTLFWTQDLEKHTLFSGTYLYRPNKGVPPPPRPRQDQMKLNPTHRSTACDDQMRTFLWILEKRKRHVTAFHCKNSYCKL